MKPVIGYYVHHHGDGHRQRALALAALAGGRMVLLGTGLAGRTGDVRCIDLPDDRLDGGFDGGDNSAGRPLALHYAPLHHPGVRARAALIAGWIAAERPALMVVDVSVEAALLARLCATPTIYVRLAGRRDDPAHLEAFRGARALLAPYAEALDDPAVPGWIRRNTRYCPGIVAARPALAVSAGDVVLAVFGKGGVGGDGNAIAAAARATQDRQWRVMGPASTPSDLPDNLTMLDWVDDPMQEIARAGTIVGGAGDGLVNAVIAARRRFVCIPEPRPFDEQVIKASRLAALHAAIALPAWPEAAQWPEVLAAAERLDPSALAGLDDPDGTAKTWALISRLADE